MNVGIIGCGLIGQKRAAVIGGDDRVVAVADVVAERAEALARPHRARVCSTTAELLADPSIQTVVVATPHNELAGLTLAAVRHGKHVLLEKPGARRPDELEAVQAAAEQGGVSVHVGFNHRFHPALRKAHSLIQEGKLGPLYYIRGRYGHGGRIGYDREWRAKPEIRART
jgi:predicted dehydrogenase